MSKARVILIGSIALFTFIGGFGLYKKISKPTIKIVAEQIEEESKSVKAAPKVQIVEEPVSVPLDVCEDLPEIDRTFELFTTGSLKLPIVETISYSSQAPWLPGRLAWIADYASHYETSRHFIARSLNGHPDYFSQTVHEGSVFNVFNPNKKIEFYLLVDLSRCKMALYYFDLDTQERVLIKTYQVAVGKSDPKAASGSLTPIGRFEAGDKIAIYKPGMRGYYGNREVELIQVFGTRWIPFGNGYGLEGAPWSLDKKTGQLIEDRSVIGKQLTEGGIRLFHEDIEELFSIVITKPTYIEVVKDFHQAFLPGTEVATPRKS